MMFNKPALLDQPVTYLNFERTCIALCDSSTNKFMAFTSLYYSNVSSQPFIVKRSGVAMRLAERSERS